MIFAINNGIFFFLLFWVFVAVLRLFAVAHGFSPIVVGGGSLVAHRLRP